jgi:hypothetical protein
MIDKGHMHHFDAEGGASSFQKKGQLMFFRDHGNMLINYDVALVVTITGV